MPFGIPIRMTAEGRRQIGQKQPHLQPTASRRSSAKNYSDIVHLQAEFNTRQLVKIATRLLGPIRSQERSFKASRIGIKPIKHLIWLA